MKVNELSELFRQAEATTGAEVPVRNDDEYANMTRNDFLNLNYSKRAKIQEEDPELYNRLMK